MRLSKGKLYFLIGGILLVVVFFNLYLGLALYIGRTATQDTKKTSDVILVLGAKAYQGDTYNPCLVSRVSHAVALYKGKYAPMILMSGGVDREDHVSEADTMKKIAVQSGVSVKNILLEKSSTSTYENFVNSQKILQKAHLRRVLIVTEPFHAARAALVAEKLGIEYTMSPVMTSSCWVPWKYLSRYFLKEPFAVMVYKMENKL